MNADGQIVAAGSGKPDPATLREAIDALLDLGRREGTLDPKALPLRPEALAAGSLSYPGKVIVAGERLWVAGTGHDQVVELGLDGEEIRRFDVKPSTRRRA